MQVTFLIWHEVINTTTNIRELSSLTFLIRPNTFVILTLVHGMGEICLSKRSSESIKTPSSVSILVNLIRCFQKVIWLVFQTQQETPFSELAFIWLFVNQVKRLSGVDCNLEITVSVSAEQMYSVVSSA